MSSMWDGFSLEKRKQINKDMEVKYQEHTEILKDLVAKNAILAHPDMINDDEDRYHDPINYYSVDFEDKVIRRELDNFEFSFSYIRLEKQPIKSTYAIRAVFSKPVTESKPGFELLCYKNEKLTKFSPVKDKQIDERLTLLYSGKPKD